MREVLRWMPRVPSMVAGRKRSVWRFVGLRDASIDTPGACLFPTIIGSWDERLTRNGFVQ